jgi:hypothetical protein
MASSARLVPAIFCSPYSLPLQLPQAASAGHRQRVGHDSIKTDSLSLAVGMFTTLQRE